MMVDMPSLTAATWTQGNNVSFDASEDEIKGTTTGEQTVYWALMETGGQTGCLIWMKSFSGEKSTPKYSKIICMGQVCSVNLFLYFFIFVKQPLYSLIFMPGKVFRLLLWQQGTTISICCLLSQWIIWTVKCQTTKRCECHADHFFYYFLSVLTFDWLELVNVCLKKRLKYISFFDWQTARTPKCFSSSTLLFVTLKEKEKRIHFLAVNRESCSFCFRFYQSIEQIHHWK